MKLRQMFLLGGNLWQDTFCWEVHAGGKPVKCCDEADSCGILGMSGQQSTAEKLRRQAASGTHADLQQNLEYCISIPTKNKHGT